MILFMDGFDFYNDNTEASKRWTDAWDAKFVTGRFGSGQALYWEANDYLYKILPETQEFVFGMGFQTDGISGNKAIIGFRDAGTDQVTVYVDTDGSIKVYRGQGATLLGTSATGLITDNVWYHIEGKFKIDNSTGTFEIKVGGVSVLSDTGVDTQNTANAYMNRIHFGYASAENRYIDDLYILDTTGTENNDFLGDCRIETIRPEGVGNSTDFTPSTGANWENVDDTFPDDDSTYNYHAPQGLPGTDLFAMEDLTTISGEIFAIQPVMYTRKDDAGSVNLSSVIRTGGADYVGSGISLPDAYVFHTDILELNPDGDVDWTVTTVNAVEGGYRRTS